MKAKYNPEFENVEEYSTLQGTMGLIYPPEELAKRKMEIIKNEIADENSNDKFSSNIEYGGLGLGMPLPENRGIKKEPFDYRSSAVII